VGLSKFTVGATVSADSEGIPQQHAEGVTGHVTSLLNDGPENSGRITPIKHPTKPSLTSYTQDIALLQSCTSFLNVPSP
jgi:hypothetical protein